MVVIFWLVSWAARQGFGMQPRSFGVCMDGKGCGIKSAASSQTRCLCVDPSLRPEQSRITHQQGWVPVCSPANGRRCFPASPGLRSKAGTYLFHLSRYLLSVPGFLRAGLPYKWKRLPQFLPLVLTLSSSHNALNPKIRTFTPSWLLSATSRLPDLSVLTTTVSGPWSFFDG